MSARDLQINCLLREIFARRRVDLQTLTVCARRGTVLVCGEFRILGSELASSSRASHLELLESEIRLVPGIRKVLFELTNWRRDDGGRWIPSSQDRSVARGRAGPGVSPDRAGS